MPSVKQSDGSGMRSMRVTFLFFFACMLTCSGGALAQDLRVLVLDALDGKPQANVKVQPLCAGPSGNSPQPASFTNTNGIALIRYACNEKQSIEISVFPPNKKDQCGADAKTNLRDATSDGLISDPSSTSIGGMSCPTRVSKKLKSVPGQITIFVKKPTWWQSHFAG